VSEWERGGRRLSGRVGGGWCGEEEERNDLRVFCLSTKNRPCSLNYILLGMSLHDTKLT
jgi:hypothetical protein